MDTIFLDDFSEEVWRTTYKYHTDNNIDDTFKRVASAVASVEKTPELQKKWEEKFYKILTNFRFCAGGRILANAGTNWKGVTLMNCFVGPKPKYDQDSLEGIFSVLLSQSQTLKSEGGWGMNFSFIRPRGSFIHGVGVESPGSCKYAELFDKSSDVITSGSGLKSKNDKSKEKIRKGAMMAINDIWHPDVEEWITAKLQEGRLTKFNISINCSNEFMDKISLIQSFQKIIDNKSYQDLKDYDEKKYLNRIEELNKWDLIFPDTTFDKYKEEWDGNINLWKSKGYPVKIFKTVKVTELWEKIMQSTYSRNDPGVLFMDRANETHCWNYGGNLANIAATNPCGEQCLPFGSVCNLGSMNIARYINEKGEFNILEFSKDVETAVRFLDNVNDLTKAPILEYTESIKKRRRIGLGVMGWGSSLYMMKIRFGSDEAEKFKKGLMESLTISAITASVDLAKTKGMFEGCDPNKHANHLFFRRIFSVNDPLYEKIKKYGIRNSALFSIQPTGNTGILADVVSGGGEPVFLFDYNRTVIVNNCPEHLISVTPKYWEGEFKETEMFKFTTEGGDKILRGIDKNGIVFKIDKNRGLTKEVSCIDYGVRKLKEKNEWNPKADWAVTTAQLTVEEHLKDMKGWAYWLDSSMSKTVNIPNDYNYEKFKNIYLESYNSGLLKGITTYREGTMNNVLSSKKDSISKTIAIKRPKELLAEIFQLKYKKENLYVAIGFYGSDPYEVFAGFNIKHYIENSKGKIIKNARSKYTFITDTNSQYDLSNGINNENVNSLCRLISTGLRHGCDISFLVHQLEKTEGDLSSFSKVICRILKKYIKENTKISGEECPKCKTSLVRIEGCKTCKSCSWTACG